jgi:hypothetical protein
MDLILFGMLIGALLLGVAWKVVAPFRYGRIRGMGLTFRAEPYQPPVNIHIALPPSQQHYYYNNVTYQERQQPPPPQIANTYINVFLPGGQGEVIDVGGVAMIADHANRTLIPLPVAARKLAAVGLLAGPTIDGA